MGKDKITIRNIKGFVDINIEFDFSDNNLLVITGKNGIGKTSIVKSFFLIEDPQVFQRTAGLSAVRDTSYVNFELSDQSPFTFSYNKKLGVLDSKDLLPMDGEIISELPIPYGRRFQQFSLISSYDSHIRANIAASQYAEAAELKEFLSKIYLGSDYEGLKVTQVNKHKFYFILRDGDYYIREDHLSSGEFFLIQLFRLVTSGASLLIIDEFDVALDASAQVNLYGVLKKVLDDYKSRLIIISHSLAFMEKIDEGSLYYLERNAGIASLEQRSFWYVKSDLYGFRGSDRYIITEDLVLAGFISHLIQKNLKTFFQYKIIPVGGQPQIEQMAKKNDSDEIFASPHAVIIVVDRDIFNKINYDGESEVLSSPVDDIELYIWRNKDDLIPACYHPQFKRAKSDKDTSKTFWKKLIRSGSFGVEDLYEFIVRDNQEEVNFLIDGLRRHLCYSAI